MILNWLSSKTLLFVEIYQPSHRHVEAKKMGVIIYLFIYFFPDNYNQNKDIENARFYFMINIVSTIFHFHFFAKLYDLKLVQCIWIVV